MPRNRKKETRKIAKCFHIYCEGEKTERFYLEGFISSLTESNRTIPVVKVEKTRKNTAIALVDEAIKKKREASTPDGDIFWVVYDRENPADSAERLHAKAVDKANGNNIYIAISNVCFEMWILLHFQPSNKPFTNCDELTGDKIFKDHLAKIGINNYEKSAKDLFDRIKHLINDARTNAERMNAASTAASPALKDKLYNLNPYCDIPKLLSEIERFLDTN